MYIMQVDLHFCQIIKKMLKFEHMLRKGLLVIFFGLNIASSAFAQEIAEPKEVKATIESIEETAQEGVANFYVFQARTGLNELFRVDTGDSYPDGLYIPLRVGDQVNLRVVDMPDGSQQVYFDDKVRTPVLLILFFVFALITIGVGFFRGLFSLIGLGITISILGFFLLPSILAGKDPVLYTVLASIMILFFNIHLSHGLKLRTFFAFLGTMSGLLIVWVLTLLFTRVSSLSGLGTEESSLLLWEIEAVSDPIRIFAAAAILGAVGVLDDIAVAQAEVVAELAHTDPTLSRTRLFWKAMRLGQHHIASTVNTLVLVYAGTALPAFLLFFSASTDINSFLNNEVVAEEFIRTLAGTTALILTVPLATLFAVLPKIDSIKKQG